MVIIGKNGGKGLVGMGVPKKNETNEAHIHLITRGYVLGISLLKGS